MKGQPESKQRRSRLRFPPVESQIMLALFAALLGVFAVRSDEFGGVPVLLMAAMFVGGILTKRAWPIYLMLGTLIWINYFVEPPYAGARFRNLQFSDLVVTLVVIALAAACFRFFETDRFVTTFYPNSRLGDKPTPGNKFEFPSLLGGRWWTIPLAVFLALILLDAIPYKRTDFFRQFRIQPFASRLFFLVLFLFFAWYVCRAAVGTIVRWRMKPDQADVHCRSLIASEFWKDMNGIEQRRLKNEKAR